VVVVWVVRHVRLGNICRRRRYGTALGWGIAGLAVALLIASVGQPSSASAGASSAARSDPSQPLPGPASTTSPIANGRHTGLPRMAAAPPHDAKPVQYVALGDSYSSGVGAGKYSGGACERSSNAYPSQWAATHQVQQLTFRACAGATVASVTSTQLSALTAATTLVSITVGGNDVGFTSVMTDCLLRGTATCISVVNAAEQQVRSSLDLQLMSLYRAITSRAPGATVIAVGYPSFYDLSSTRTCPGLSASARAKINEGAAVLDTVIHDAARSAGVAYLDVRAAFAGHEICDGTPWLHDLDVTELSASYHPTAAGQLAYTSAFTSATAAYR
jgi:lysophospholipase L1-like esterase